MAHTGLDLRERRANEDMLNAKLPVSKIAAEIGRHRSSVYREIKRNTFSDEELPHLNGYYGVNAHRCAALRRARCRKLIRLRELRDAVIDRLKEGWSPEQIAGRLPFEGQSVTVSHETIHAYVYSNEGQSEALARYLPDRRKQRKPRYARRPRGLVFPPDRSIHERPDDVKDRATFGDWEGDLMIFRKEHGKANVASLVERKTRYAVLFRNNDRSSPHLMNRLMNVLEPLPRPARRSITFDRGIEFSGCASLPDVDWSPGDRGYDADWFRDAFRDRGIRARIPGRKHRKAPVRYDTRRYRRRNRIEIMFGKLKDWRRVATRYDRCPKVFLSAIALAAFVTH